jgi:hypothetical protein
MTLNLTLEDKIKVVSYATGTQSIVLRLRANSVRRYVFHNANKTERKNFFSKFPILRPLVATKIRVEIPEE